MGHVIERVWGKKKDLVSLWLCSLDYHYNAFFLSDHNTLGVDHDPLFYVITGALHTDM